MDCNRPTFTVTFAILSIPALRRTPAVAAGVERRSNGRSWNWSNAVADGKYIERLQLVIHQLHGCDSRHIQTAPVHESFKGGKVWDGEIEIFELVGHPRTRWCYAWCSKEGANETVNAILQIPPVISPGTAVRAVIVRRQL